MKSIRLTAILLTLLVSLPLLTACGGTASDETADTVAAGETAAETVPSDTEPAYVYPTADLGGDTISILNIDAYWGMHVEVDVNETTGEVLNDAIYNRNRLVEEQFNCVIHDDKLAAKNDLSASTNAAQKEILAGEGTHDVMYVRDDNLVNFFTQNLLQDLKNIPELHLNEAWWDGAYNSIAQVGDSILGAAGDAHLMGYDSSWCIFFNEDIITDNGLDLPYDLAREGGWTLDKLHEYAAAVAMLT